MQKIIIKKNIIYLLCLILIDFNQLFAQLNEGFQIARLKYNGGSDWYNDPSAEVNLLDYLNQTVGVKVKTEYAFVDISRNDIFQYPFLFMTGHGTINFSDEEAKRLRLYLENGGFLYADDDYGLDKSFRKEIKKVFPEKELVELPFNHPIYHVYFDFQFGPPKIHEHDNKPPQGFGIFIDKRLVVYYTYESNPSDGWADPSVHGDSEDKRIEALKFGVNIILYSMLQ